MSKRIRKRFKNVALFGKPRAESMRDTIAAIAALVERAGQTVLLELETQTTVGLDRYPGLSIEAIGRSADVAIVLGGDGTMLGVARELAPYHVPLIGINQGRLGFITDIALDQVEEVLPTMLAGEFEVDQRTQIDAELVRDGAVAYHARALNDIVVSRGVAGGMVEFTVRVDGVTMYNQRGDGVILATPTGSTAYSLSANGPILHPSLAGLVLVPVAPQTLSNRPIALADSALVEIEITDVRDASAHFDMQTFARLSPGDIVRARKARDAVTLLHPIGYNYFATLRSKLHWSVMPSEPHGHV
jgi:NAD+ kinase